MVSREQLKSSLLDNKTDYTAELSRAVGQDKSNVVTDGPTDRWTDRPTEKADY